MKKILNLLLLTCISTFVFGQSDIIRTNPVSPTTGAANYNKQRIVDANLKIALTLNIPTGTAFTHNNSTPAVGNIFYNTTTNQFGVWNGTIWQTIGGSSYTIGYGMSLVGQQLRVDTSTIASREFLDTKIKSSLYSSNLTYFGDSFTYGYGLENYQDRYTYQLSKSLFGYENNNGYDGSMVGYLAGNIANPYRMTTRLAEIPKYSANENLLSIYYGTNDLVLINDTTKFKSSLDTVFNHATTVKGWPASRILLLTPTIRNDGIAADTARVLKYVKAIYNYSKSKNTKFYDIYHLFKNNGGLTNIQPDGVHPSIAGNKLIADSVSFYLKNVLPGVFTNGPNKGLISSGNLALSSNTTGNNNLAFGSGALEFNTTGQSLISIGANSARNNTTGSYITAIGNNSLQSNTTGSYNIAIGDNVLNANTTGSNLIGIGSEAFGLNKSGSYSIGIGRRALYSNTTGAANFAAGDLALSKNTTGNFNIAISSNALASNTTGYGNIGIGSASLLANNTGLFNLAFGNESSMYNSVGSNNISIGQGSLKFNLTDNNFGIGSNTLGLNVSGTRSGAVGTNTLSKSLASDNYGFGFSSQSETTTGNANSSFGTINLGSNTTGSYNNGYGSFTLDGNITGNNNNIFGSLGFRANISGSNNTGMGSSVLSSSRGDDNVAIGTNGLKELVNGNGNTAVGTNITGLVTGNFNTIVGKYTFTNPTTSNIVVIADGENTTPRLYGDASHNLGVNNVNPSEKLDVNGKLRVRVLDNGIAGTDSLLTEVNGVLRKISPTYYSATGGGGGTVTSVGKTDSYANTITITNPTTTPNITVNLDTTGVNGLVSKSRLSASLALKQNLVTLTTTSSPTSFSQISGALNIQPYVLPISTGSLLGGVKIGSGLAVDGSGVLSATASLALKANFLNNNSRIVEFGDSFTKYGDNTGNPYFDSWGFTTWLNIYTGGKLFLPLNGNRGIGGNTTVQMVARLNDVIALNPQIVTFIGGTNDIAILGSPAVDIQSRIKTIVDAFTAINAKVVIGTICPRYGTSALTAPQEVIRLAVNAYILTLASDNVKVVDNETSMTGSGLYQSDGLHPNTTGAMILGSNMATPINAMLSTTRITEAISQDNALTTNVALTGTSGSLNTATGQVATSYTLNASNSGGATVVGSKTTVGSTNQQVITISGTKTGTNKLIQFGSNFVTGTIATGDVTNSFIDFEVTSALTNVTGISVSTNYNGSGGYLADSYSYFPIDNTPISLLGRYQLRGYNFVAPSGVTNVDTFVTIFLADGSVSVGGAVKIWKAGVQEVTANSSTIVLTTTGTGNASLVGSTLNIPSLVNSITGTSNQVTASSSTGAITLSLPQSIHTGAFPQFAGLGIGTAADGVNALKLRAGTTAGAPLLLTAGTNTTTLANGRVEYDGTNLYFTTGGVRQTVAFLASPAFTGTPTAPTATATDLSTKLSTTAFAGSRLVLTGSGTGAATTISIAHGLAGITSGSFVIAQPRNAASTGISYVTVDATNVNILYTVAPASGTGNLSYSVEIKP